MNSERAKTYCYEKSIELYPKFTDSYLNLALVYRNLLELEKAVSVYQKIIKINPDNAKIYQGLGDVYLDQQEWEKAIAAYEKALSIDPMQAITYHALGLLYSLYLSPKTGPQAKVKKG